MLNKNKILVFLLCCILIVSQTLLIGQEEPEPIEPEVPIYDLSGQSGISTTPTVITPFFDLSAQEEEVYLEVEAPYDPNPEEISTQAQKHGPTIWNYAFPCEYDTGGNVTTVHGVDANPDLPVDMDRHSYDIRCDKNDRVHSPTAGTVFDIKTSSNSQQNQLWVDDVVNNVCLVFVHIQDFKVKKGDSITNGQYIAISNGAGTHVHLTAFDGPCSGGISWTDAFEERPIAWIELGYILPANVSLSNLVYFMSKNTPFKLTTVWDLATKARGWHLTENLEFTGYTNGGMNYDIPTSDSQIFGPLMPVGVRADEYPYLLVSMASNSDSCGEVYFRTSYDGSFHKSRKATFTLIPDGQNHLYAIDMRQSDKWVHYIIQLRLDPACYKQSDSDWVRINYVALAKQTPGATAPNAPVNVAVSPNHGRPIISWAQDFNAEWYEVWVGNASGQQYSQWHHRDETALCGASICTLSPEIYPVGGTYETWIRAWGFGSLTNWSGPATFDLPTTAPNPPANFNVSGGSNPIFSWAGAENVTWYEIWAGNSDTWEPAHQSWYKASDLGCVGSVTCTLPLSLSLAPGNYNFYVRSWGPGGFNSGGILDSWVEGKTFTVSQ